MTRDHAAEPQGNSTTTRHENWRDSSPQYKPCPSCGKPKDRAANFCRQCKWKNSPKRICPKCGGKKHSPSELCKTCRNLHTREYWVCPQCGGEKDFYSAVCKECRRKNMTTVVSDEVFFVKGEPCRNIGLTQGQVAGISAHRYEEISQYEWYADFHPKAGTFYAKRKLPDGTAIYMHRQIRGGDSPHIDHIDGNGLHNWDSNLRPASTSQNVANSGKRKTNTSGFKGVTLIKHRSSPWHAQLMVNYRHVHIGSFTTPEEEARAYDKMALRYFGEYAQLNFPRSDYQ